MKKFLLFLVVIAMFFSLFGCKRKPDNTGLTKEEAQAYLEKTLEEKYGKDFEVSELENRHSSGPFNNTPGFAGIASEAGSNEVFQVEYSSNSGTVTDDYPKLTYGRDLEREAGEIIEKYEFLTMDSLHGVYPQSVQNWLQEGYDAYLQSAGVYISADLTMDPEVVSEEKAEEVLALCEEMVSHSIYFSLHIYHNDRTTVVSCRPGDEMPTLEYIYEKLARR